MATDQRTLAAESAQPAVHSSSRGFMTGQSGNDCGVAGKKKKIITVIR
jgi:hypothetical protein